MMINKRLINMIGKDKKYIAGNVLFQWCSLAANVFMIGSISYLLSALFDNTVTEAVFLTAAAVTLVAVMVRFLCSIAAGKMSYLSSKTVKKRCGKRFIKSLYALGVPIRNRYPPLKWFRSPWRV